MIPCTTTWRIVGFRTVGLNNEPIQPAWGFTRAHSERRWLRRYDTWLRLQR